METNVSVQYSSGFLPDIPYVNSILYLQPMFPPERFDIFPSLVYGMLGRFECVHIFL